VSETYKRYPFEYDIPPTPPPATFAIWDTPDGNQISPEITVDTVFFTSSDGSVTITSVPATDTIDFISSGTGSASNVDVVYTADVNITDRDIVYVSSTDRVSPAQANTQASKNAIGFAMNTALAGASVTVRVAGEVDSLSGFNPNDTLYLSGTTAGALTTTAPVTGSGHWVVQVGQGRTTTEAVVIINKLGRRN
jgi:hypothetical protein